MSVVAGPFKTKDKPEDKRQLGAFSPVNWQGRTPPPLEWLVEGCFLKGTVAMLSGDGGLGKSLLMQQLMTAAARGKDWLGMFAKPVKSLGLFCEDDRDELHRRQARINAHLGCDMADLEDMLIEARPGADSVLIEFPKFGGTAQTTRLFDELRAAAKDHGAQLVVIDTRRDVFRGNEIDYSQANQTVRVLRRLAIELQGVVILTDHPSNEGLSSGSGISGNRAWSNSVRSRLYLTRPGKNPEERVNDRVLKTMKSNSAPLGKVELTWRDGVFVRTDGPAKSRHWMDEEVPF